MNKFGILPINNNTLTSTINFKQLILLFDKIIIEKNCFELVNELSQKLKDKKSILDFNNSNIDFLIDKELLIQHDETYILTINEENHDKSIKETSSDNWQNVISGLENRGIMKRNAILNDNKVPYSIARDLSLHYNSNGIEAFPIYKKQPDYSEKGKKEQIINFTLSQLPSPADDVSWEQILDFKKDPDSMTKYYRLINWINEVSRGEIPMGEIEDKYNHLYHEYLEQYRIHKMKFKQTKLEIIATFMIDCLASPIGITNIKSSLFNLFKGEMNLLEAETNFIGREIAYIAKAKQAF